MGDDYIDGVLQRRRVDLDQVGGSALTLGQKTKANSIPVTLASDEDALPITTPKSSTGTQGNITITTSSTTVLASNSSRLGYIIKNNGTQTVFINFGGTAVVTNQPLEAGQNMEDDGDGLFTGVINGIVSASTLNVRVTEFT